MWHFFFMGICMCVCRISSLAWTRHKPKQHFWGKLYPPQGCGFPILAGFFVWRYSQEFHWGWIVWLWRAGVNSVGHILVLTFNFMGCPGIVSTLLANRLSGQDEIKALYFRNRTISEELRQRLQELWLGRILVQTDALDETCWIWRNYSSALSSCFLDDIESSVSDAFFRKSRELGIISSEIHHWLLEKEDGKKINPVRSIPVTPAQKQHGDNSHLIKWLWDGECPTEWWQRQNWTTSLH